MTRRLLFMVLAAAYLMFNSLPAMAAIPQPNRVGGTITIDGVLQTAAIDNLVVTVTKADGTTALLANDGTGTNVQPVVSQVISGGSLFYLYDVPIFDATDQTLGASPASSAIIKVAINGSQYTITSPASGAFTVGNAGDLNGTLNLTMTSPVVVRIDQAITGFAPTATATFGDAPVTLSATGGASGNPVTFSVVSGPGTVSGTNNSTLTITGAGTIVVSASQAGNSAYNAAPDVTQSIVVAQASQTISFGAAPSLSFGGAAGTVSATATSGLAVTFTSSTPDVCTISGSTVTPVAGGACIIAANQAGDANYSAAAEATQNITVAANSQTIAFGAAPSLTFGGTGAVSATATSGLDVAFTSTTPTVCSLSGTTVTGLAGGTCTIAANQAGNANFGAAPQVTQDITVATTAPGQPTVTATPANESAIVTITGSTGGEAITGYSITATNTTTGVVGAPIAATASPVTVTGLTNGDVYTFTATATNSVGTSPVSAASNAVTPNLLTPTIGAPSAAIAKAGATVTYTVTYVGAAAITLADFNVTVNTTDTAAGTAVVSGSGTDTRTVTISGITGDGTIGITLAADTATDVTGTIHAQASAASATFIVDNTAPALAVTALADATVTSNNTLNVSGTVTDANGVATLTVNDAAVVPLANGTFSTAVTLVSGSNTITVVATDAAGNATTNTRTITFDNSAPEITLVAPTPSDNSFTNLQSVTIAGTVSEPGTVEVSANGAITATLTTSGATNSFTTTVTNLVDGANTITVKASDLADTPNSSTVQRTVTFDTAAPTLAITDPASAITTSFSDYLVKGTVGDNFAGSTITFSVDGVDVTPAPTVAADGSFQQSVALADVKTYQITVTATDLAGNASTVQRSIVRSAYTIVDALRALRIAAEIETQTAADLARLDVGPLNSGVPAKDGVINLADAIILLRLVVGDLAGVTSAN